ncbi:hypothetical protein DL991_27165 [Amycolatopsis sp. WAC 01375]|uniref:DUF4303 domain-containing protein n=1 Tax=Amycolatopsis sp. WAC 01375 TaxID=2203194 RepID=UPI000F7AE95B|nr:DUF4303 domain-containing protein [Amycolatopsis sp. WAC 01375]RSM75803.1 hypothetical protein DL991_27165 [Amycolatopsis sp. WAC 01375]RSN26273.1 hypothetical protein DL990_32935 [Amycolatopsis sp. WAC 01416]
MTVNLDWAEFERTLREGVVQSVVSAMNDHPGERFYAAVLDHIYREEDGPIALPLVGINSVEALVREPAEHQADLRWSAPDWDLYHDDWLPEGMAGRWEKALTTEACSGTTRHWQKTFDRYLTMLVRVCRQARTTLRRNGNTHPDFVVVLLDDEYRGTLIRRVLSTGEVRRHFPELDERSVALADVAALPPAERAAYLASLLGTFDGPLDPDTVESALRDLGPTGFPVLISLLGTSDRAWQAAKLLADIGSPDDGVIQALRAALGQTDGANQEWVAVALSRVGRLDIVLDQVERLPADVVVSAVAAPYTSFRDDAVTPLMLDYQPLTGFIERWPEYVPALGRRLAPGQGYCDIAADEVDAAVAGLTSPHVIVRQHAVQVLGQRRLGRHVGRRVLPLLCQTIRLDQDASVRRLAVLSLLWWRRDSRHLADVVREASEDPAAEVREVAAYWLREQRADEPI